MGNNVVAVPFGEIADIEAESDSLNQRKSVESFMVVVNDWAASNGIDTSTEAYRYKASTIMSQLHVILMGDK